MSAVSVEVVGRTLGALLRQDGRVVRDDDAPTGRSAAIDPQAAAAAAGALPAFVVAGEAVWREATGGGFKLDVVRDPQALMGYRLRAIGAGSFATVMLSVMEAVHQVGRRDAIVLNDLNALWSASTERVRWSAQPGRARAAGASP